MWPHYRPCIPDKCHVVIKLFHNFKARFWKCYHLTMNIPHLTFFAKVTQCWCNAVILRLKRCCGFDVAVVYITFSQRYKFDVIVLTLWIWRFQCCNNIVNATCISRRELNILSSVDETLEKCCNLDDVTSTSLQFWCNVIITLSTLPLQLHDMLWDEFTIQQWSNVVTTLWICRHSINVVKTLWIWRHIFSAATEFPIQHS